VDSADDDAQRRESAHLNAASKAFLKSILPRQIGAKGGLMSDQGTVHGRAQIFSRFFQTSAKHIMKPRMLKPHEGFIHNASL
jgi:hypothetical protein